MIRHRPHGRGHPYEQDPDQRVPAQPVAGEPTELRATTDVGIDSVTLDLERGGTLAEIAAAGVAFDEDQSARKGDEETHLSAAATSHGTNRSRWVVVLDRLEAHEHVRYRFKGVGRGRTELTRWHEFVAGAWEKERGELQLDVAGGPRGRLDTGSVSWLVAGEEVQRVRFALTLAPGEHVVGFGERFNHLDQRGHAFDSVVFEQYKQQGARTYMPMPFAIVAGGGWGFHVATSRRVWFDVGSSDADRLWIEAELDGSPRPALSLELYEGSPDRVLAGFLERTGHPKLPPDWIFTPWMSGNEWNTQARVLREVERGEREQIPAGVVVIEAWSDEATFSAFRDAEYKPHEDGSPHQLRDFTFPPDGAWPDPKGMVDSLHARGLRLLLWQIPLLRPDGDSEQLRYDRAELVRRGYAVRQTNGRPYANRSWWFPRSLLPDFTSAEARKWWTEKRRYLVDELGIDGFKTDGGEHAWGHDLRYADGSSGSETNNRYPVLYARAYHELLERAGCHGVTFSRAGFTGAPAYPCHWAGDESSTWEAFRASIIAGLTAGACGVFFWGWDFAGFSGEIPSAELYLRAAAAACFCPIMQYHSEFNHHRLPSRDRTPWNVAERTSDERVIPVYRRFAQLRMQLVQYLAEQARLAVDRSKPLMRAPFFEDAADEQAWKHPYQYFLGDDLFVAPVVEPARSDWTVCLPDGDWVDAWTGDAVDGGLTIQRAAPISEIPVYVRARRARELLPAFASLDTAGTEEAR